MPDWISVEEAAQLSQYNTQHIRYLIREKKIVAQKKGIMWWVDQKSLLAYIKVAAQSTDKRWGPKRE